MSNTRRKDQIIADVVDKNIDVLSTHVNDVFSRLKNIKEGKHSSYDDYAFLQGVLLLQSIGGKMLRAAGVTLDQDRVAVFYNALFKTLYAQNKLSKPSDAIIDLIARYAKQMMDTVSDMGEIETIQEKIKDVSDDEGDASDTIMEGSGTLARCFENLLPSLIQDDNRYDSLIEKRKNADTVLDEDVRSLVTNFFLENYNLKPIKLLGILPKRNFWFSDSYRNIGKLIRDYDDSIKLKGDISGLLLKLDNIIHNVEKWRNSRVLKYGSSDKKVEYADKLLISLQIEKNRISDIANKNQKELEKTGSLRFFKMQEKDTPKKPAGTAHRLRKTR